MTPPSPVDPLLERLRVLTAATHRVLGELGRGGMAVVYLAHDLNLDRLVAIKVMDPRLSLVPEMPDRFLREARTAARMQHPNIIVIHDIRQDGELTYFVMGFVDGMGVDELCRERTPVGVDEARWIILHAARALAHAHGEGVVHRDIKPSNILVNVKGDVILTDFGIAKSVDGTSLTKSGAQIGTPAYMSPEQFSDGDVEPSSDQYSLGVTAYQLLTGRLPFVGGHYQLMTAHKLKAPPPLRPLNEQVPTFLASAVMRMLEKDPAHRWPSLHDVAEVFGANLPSDGRAARASLAAAALQYSQGHSRPGVEVRRGPGSASPVPASASATPTPTTIALSPSAATILVGTTIEFLVSITDGAGGGPSNPSLLWSSSDPDVARVEGDGRVRGLSAGEARIAVRVGNRVGEARVTVESPPIARIDVTPQSLHLQVRDRQPFVPRVVDVTGRVREDVVPQCVIDQTGEIVRLIDARTIEGVGVGVATMRVSSPGCETVVPVQVVRRPAVRIEFDVPGPQEVGAAFAIRAAGVDDLGSRVQAPVSFRSESPRVAHVDRQGSALAIAPGRCRIAATLDAVSAICELDIIEPPIASLLLPQAVVEMDVGDDVALDVRALDADGVPRSLDGVEFTLDRHDAITFDQSSLVVSARRPGDTQISVAVRRPPGDTASTVIRASCVVRVRASEAIVLEVTDPLVQFDVGDARVVRVRAIDQHGAVKLDDTLVWRSGNPQVVTVVGDGPRKGTLTAVGVGDATVRVALENPSGSVVSRVIDVRVREALTAVPPTAVEETARPAEAAPTFDDATKPAITLVTSPEGRRHESTAVPPTDEDVLSNGASESEAREEGMEPVRRAPWSRMVLPAIVGVLGVGAVVWLMSTRAGTSTAPPVDATTATPEVATTSPPNVEPVPSVSPGLDPNPRTFSATPDTQRARTAPAAQRGQSANSTADATGRPRVEPQVPTPTNTPTNRPTATAPTTAGAVSTSTVAPTVAPAAAGAMPPASPLPTPTPTPTIARTESLAVATPPPTTAPRELSLSELESAANGIVARLRAEREAASAPLRTFFATGDEHTLTRTGALTLVESGSRATAQFDLQLVKQRFVGTRYRAVVQVTFRAERTESGVRTTLLTVTQPPK